MPNLMNHKIVITLIGAGNLAWHVGIRLKQAGYIFNQIFSRNSSRADELAVKLMGRPVTSLKDINNNSDIYLLAIPDDALTEVCSTLIMSNKVVLHTSGATDMKILENTSTHFGVLYPVQTFSRMMPVEWSDIPVCIEGNNEGTTEIIYALATALSSEVYNISSEKRRLLHHAAVWTNNFTNHLLTVAMHLMAKEGLDPNILYPLAKETVRKAFEMEPAKAQTGPARRGDSKVMQMHLDMLENDPKLQVLYKYLADSITDATSTNKFHNN